MAFTESEAVEAVLELEGVWIHDPSTGGQESARQYLFGASQKSDSLDTLGEGRYYAGRADPVVDYGEHQALAVAVTIDVPHGETWRDDLDDLLAFAAGKATVHYRDNRGRAVYGQMTDFKRSDQSWGTQVGFTITQSAWDRELVS